MHGKLQFFLPSFVNFMGKSNILFEKKNKIVPLESILAKSW
jgi:hypothetical protein